MKQELLEANKNKVQLFQNEEFGSIRTIIVDGNPWFVAADVCRILEHTNPSIAMNSLENFEKAKLNLGIPGGATNIISESGFYTLVLRSRKPIAKPFRIWVTNEVLPSIRKNGSYSVQQSDNDNKLNTLISEIANLKIVYSQISNVESILKTQQESIEDINNTISSKLDTAIDNMTLSTRQQEIIHEIARKRVNNLLGGAHSKEYKKDSRTYFINLWNGLKEAFHCGSSWKDLNPCDFDKAVSWIGRWEYSG